MNKYLSTVHVWLALVCVTWVGTPHTTWFWSCLIWLAGSALVLGLAFPAVRRGESPDRARARCWWSLAHDPFLFAAVLALMFLVVQALNGGRELMYDAVSEQWGFGVPAWPWLPSHVVPEDAWRAAASFCVFMCTCLAVRHTMGKRARLLLLHGLSLNAAVLALWALLRLLLQQRWAVSGLPGFLFDGSAIVGGAYYMLLTAISVGLAVYAADHQRFASWLMVPVVCNFLGTLLMADGAAVLAVWVFVVVAGVAGMLYAWPYTSTSQKLKLLLWGVLPLCCFAFYYFNMYPGNPLASVAGFESVVSTWSQTGDGAATAALRLWTDHFWTGVGAGGFAVFAPFYGWVTTVAPGGAVGSDYVQFLCEHGVIGCGLVGVAVGAVLYGHMRQLALLPQVTHSTWGGDQRYCLCRLTPMATTLMLGTFLICVLGVVRTVFHDAAVALVWGVVIICLGSFLPIRTQV